MRQGLDKWGKWLRPISGDLIELQLHQEIFQGVRNIVQANPNIHRPNLFYDFLTRAYLDRVLMTLRRQIDSHKDCQSFLKMLLEMQETPEVLTRERFIANYGEDSQARILGVADKVFDEMSEGGNTVSPKILEADAMRLVDAFEICKALIDKRIAHFEPGKPLSRIPTMNEIDSAIEVFRAVFQKYYLLLTGIDNDHKPGHAGWQEIFTVPWIEHEM